MNKIKIGQRYRHYKGKDYKIIAIARDSQNAEQEMVVYQALYNSPEFGPKQIWIRPLLEFCQKVEVNGKSVNRFSLLK